MVIVILLGNVTLPVYASGNPEVINFNLDSKRLYSANDVCLLSVPYPHLSETKIALSNVNSTDKLKLPPTSTAVGESVTFTNELCEGTERKDF